MTTKNFLSKAAVLGLLAVGIILTAACSAKKDSADTSSLLGKLLTTSGTNSIANFSEMAASNGENEMGNAMAGRAPDIAPLWPARGDFGFFAPEVTGNTAGVKSVTITDEIKDCPGGGHVTLSGTQTVDIQISADLKTKTITVSDGQRKVVFENCSVSPITSISAGQLTITQTGFAVLTIVQAADLSNETHTLQNLLFQIQGSADMVSAPPPAMGSGRPPGPPPGGMNGPPPSAQNGCLPPGAGGRMRPPPSGTIAFDLNINITRRVLSWTGISSDLQKPQIQERTGTVTGKVTVNGEEHEVNQSMQCRPM